MGSAFWFFVLGFIGILRWVLQALNFVIIVYAILSWLIAFDVLNVRNRTVYMIVQAFDRFMQPLLRPFRRLVPNMGGLDISPIFLILAIMVLDLILNTLQIWIRQVVSTGAIVPGG